MPKNKPFFPDANPASKLDFALDGLVLDGTSIVRKVDGNYVPIENMWKGVPSKIPREKLKKVGDLLNEGRQAEAILFASVVDWCVPKHLPHKLNRFDFNPLELRDRVSGRSSRQ